MTNDVSIKVGDKVLAAWTGTGFCSPKSWESGMFKDAWGRPREVREAVVVETVPWGIMIRFTEDGPRWSIHETQLQKL